jgi:peptidoglycan/xylan/chitin deacetylase (PgdA/CDA1 family)
MSGIVAGALRSARWSRSRRGLALVYHRVADAAGNQERELVPAVATRTFEWQLRHLRAHYRLVTASELPGAALSRRRGEPFPVAVTFDDDYRSHRRTAMPTLVRSDVTATFFLCGASLARPFSFWWELLQRAADRGVPADSILGEAGSPSRTIHEVAATLHAMDPEERAGVAARLESRLGPGSAGGGMSAEDVRALVEAGFEIGFHTQEHHPLTTLDDRALPEAMVKGKDRISQLAGRELSTIAYPYGVADGRVAAAARKAGFKIGYTTSGLPFAAETDQLLIGRLMPPASEEGFALAIVRMLARSWRSQ